MSHEEKSLTKENIYSLLGMLLLEVDFDRMKQEYESIYGEPLSDKTLEPIIELFADRLKFFDDLHNAFTGQVGTVRIDVFPDRFETDINVNSEDLKEYSLMGRKLANLKATKVGEWINNWVGNTVATEKHNSLVSGYNKTLNKQDVVQDRLVVKPTEVFKRMQ